MGQATPLRTLCVGLGPIGTAAATHCADDPRLELVGAVDPVRNGETVGGMHVVADVGDLGEREADVALVAVGSSLDGMGPLLRQLVELGVDVVSTCEELTYPWARHPRLATELDRAARSAGTTILGCGVNPGFVMDVLPTLLAGATIAPAGIDVTRTVDLAHRRPQLRAKMGVGLPPEQWLASPDGETYGHFGLVESAYLCAHGAGWTVEDVAFDRRPLIADGVIDGVREVAELRAAGGRRVRLELTFRMGVGDRDEVVIDGTPPLRVRVEGIQGDQATVARMLSGARTIGAMPPGLRLPLEAPVGVVSR